MNCPHKTPDRIQQLPVAANGYPVPFFVAIVDGKPDFRVVDPQKLVACINQQLCWICGQPLGVYRSFVVGPMGYVNRISSDACMHLECARYSVVTCPFMLNPQQKRREDERTERGKEHVGGEMIDENPGVMCVYTTKVYKTQLVGKGPLFLLGQYDSATWWARGRKATSQELERSFAVGCVLATQHCDEKEREDFRAKVRHELQQLLTGYL